MKTLYNPFEKYSETALLLVGITITIAGSLLGYLFNARFDGILDLHFVENLSLWMPFTDNFVNITVLAVLLYSSGFFVNRKIRFVDILSASLIARAPYYPLTLFNIKGDMVAIGKKLIAAGPDISSVNALDLTLILVFSLLSIGTLIWYMALLYNGFKTATNLKKTKHIILFVIMILFAEASSSYIIYLIN